MSGLELKEKIHAIIDQHAGNDAWLARVFEILEHSEPGAEGNWWNELSNEQKTRIDRSILAADRGEWVANDEVMEGL